MDFAVVEAAERGEADRILADLARSLEKKGFRLAGVVQSNTGRDRHGRCDMDVQVLPDGPTIRISQSLGTGSRGCRLDAGALETAAAEASARLSPETDLLIVNKFGKHEAEGRGFRTLISEALDRGIMVVCALNRLNRPAFEAFSAGLAIELPANADALENWVLSNKQVPLETT